MEIRAPRSTDCRAVAILCAQLGYPVTEEQVARRQELIARNGQALLLVAMGGSGKVIGWVHVFARQLLQVDRHAELGGLIVEDSWRGRGVGRRLMDEAEAWAVRQGCTALYVRSSVTRKQAHGFYLAVGYELVKSSHVFWKELMSAA